MRDVRPEDSSQPIEATPDAAAAPAASGVPAPVEPAAPDAPSASQETAAAATTDEATDRNLFGTLDADQRIRAVVKQNERTLWAGAAGVTLIYIAIIASQAMQFSAADLAEMMKRKRGQDAPDSISVELVPDPDKTAKTQKWQDGATAAQENPAELPPQQPQQPQVANLPQPKVEEAPAEEPKPEEAPAEQKPKPDDAPEADQQKNFAPTLPDLDTLVDAAAADLDRKIKRALEKKQEQQKQRQERQAVAPGGGLQLRGTGASGRSDPFSRSVIAALMKTRPGPFALWGRVLVSFQISEAGQVAYVHLLQSSGNTALDQAAINAIRKAQFERPPAGLSPDERTYIIDYIFG
jgi:TonB family protein